MSSEPTFQITSANNFVIGENCQFTSGDFKNAAGNVITLPSAAGTLASESYVDTAITNANLDQYATDSELSTLAGRVTAIENAPYVSTTGTQDLSNKTLINPVIKVGNNGANTLSLPSSAGTIALMSDLSSAISNADLSQYAQASDLSDLNAKFGRLLDYLESWISIGNISMSDIKSHVNTSS